MNALFSHRFVSRRCFGNGVRTASWLATVAFLLWTRGAAAAPMAYAVDVKNDLYRVELAPDGTVEFLTHVYFVDETISSIALSEDGRMYALDADGRFYFVNMKNGHATQIRDTGIIQAGGLDFNGDTLLGLTFDYQPTVFSIDLETGATTNVRQTVRAPGYGRALATIDENTMLLATEGLQTNNLVSMNLTTGVLSSYAQLGHMDEIGIVTALDFGGNGDLFAATAYGNIFRIEEDGAQTLLISGDRYWLGLTAVPEPSSASLVTVFLGVAGLWVRRSRGATRCSRSL